MRRGARGKNTGAGDGRHTAPDGGRGSVWAVRHQHMEWAYDQREMGDLTMRQSRGPSAGRRHWLHLLSSWSGGVGVPSSTRRLVSLACWRTCWLLHPPDLISAISPCQPASFFSPSISTTGDSAAPRSVHLSDLVRRPTWRCSSGATNGLDVP